MSGPYQINPTAFYDDSTLVRQLGLTYGAIDRGRKSGELKSTKRGGRTLFLGAWVQAWLACETQTAGAGA
jgi:hypothetical protein